MTEVVGQIWQQGENLASKHQYVEGLLCFQRAKMLLIVEAKCVYEDPARFDPLVTLQLITFETRLFCRKNAKVSKLMEAIMEKVGSSHLRYVSRFHSYWINS